MPMVTVKQAAWLAGKSKDKIYEATKNGTLSVSKNEKGHTMIDVAELVRVYDPLKRCYEDLEEASTASSSSGTEPEATALQKERLDRALAELEKETKERLRERQLFEEVINDLRKTLDSQNKALLMLTDQREEAEKRKPEQEGRLGAIEEQLKLLQAKNKHLVRRLEEEKSRSLWDRLFGGGAKPSRAAAASNS